MTEQNELVFIPLGGLGEIGMNCALYGFGPAKKRKWLLVDVGVAFAGDDLPGVDLILPDVKFVEKIKKDLVGIIITHAHEDHIGALAELWPRLGVKVYATRFAAGLLEARRLNEPGAPKIPIEIVAQGGHVTIGPFEMEFIAVAHSIPESCALAIRTPAGLIVHTGDWKIGATPLVGRPTDEARLRALGDEGVLALICDSTNVLREGESPSEADVAKNLAALVGQASRPRRHHHFRLQCPARLRAAAEAGLANGKQVMVIRTRDGAGPRRGAQIAAISKACRRSLVRIISTAYRAIRFTRALATGSQGEPRAALARIAEDEHPIATLAPGDKVIFSSRTIPGNEKAVGKIVNGLVAQGIEVITDRTQLVHVSGHPRRAELAKMYAWLRPKIAIPAHGEAGPCPRTRDFRPRPGRQRGRARPERRHRAARRRPGGDCGAGRSRPAL